MYTLSSAIVLQKQENTEQETLHLLLLYDDSTCTYYFPKCYVNHGDVMQDMLVQEVQESTGATILVHNYVSFIASSMVHENAKIRKKTHYFVAEYTGGELCVKEGFLGRVCFYTVPEALALLQFQGVHTLGFEDEYALLKQYSETI